MTGFSTIAFSGSGGGGERVNRHVWRGCCCLPRLVGVVLSDGSRSLLAAATSVFCVFFCLCGDACPFFCINSSTISLKKPCKNAPTYRDKQTTWD